ncbi:MAG TPA: TetR/AcrR family transcriptional regulator [Nitriliruptorales bacterium]|nr:TetR/AcrR family transcriptional regulator [Nitriliruptorales bacterium]
MARDDAVDPRVIRTREVVLAAVLEELAEVGHSEFTIESVAERCGVGKSTIYRHWDGKGRLIVDAMRTLNTQPTPEVERSPRDRIRQLLIHLTNAITEGMLGPAIPALIEAAERDEELRELFHAYSTNRRRALVDAIAAGIDADLIDETVDPELAAHALAGAIFYARLMTPTPLDDRAVDQLMNTVLGAPTPEPTAAGPSKTFTPGSQSNQGPQR